MSEIKVRMVKNRGQELAQKELAHQQEPRDTKRQLQALQACFQRLHPRAKEVLAQALETALWDDGSAANIQLLVRCNDDTLKGTWPSGDLGLAHASDFMLYDVLERGLDTAVLAVPSLSRGNPGKLAASERQAARELIDLYCECLGKPRPRYDFSTERVRNPAAASYTIAYLNFLKVPGARNLKVKQLVRSLYT